MRNRRCSNGVTVAAMVGVSSLLAACGGSSATRDKGSTATRETATCRCQATWHRYLRGLLGCRPARILRKRWGQDQVRAVEHERLPS